MTQTNVMNEDRSGAEGATAPVAERMVIGDRIGDRIYETCPHCGGVVVGYWKEGLLPDPKYVLVADALFYSICWDQMIKDLPDEGAYPEMHREWLEAADELVEKIKDLS